METVLEMFGKMDDTTWAVLIFGILLLLAIPFMDFIKFIVKAILMLGITATIAYFLWKAGVIENLPYLQR